MSDIITFRGQLDRLDREIVDYLVLGTSDITFGKMIDQRLAIVKQIGAYKKLYQLPIIDGYRRKEMIESRVSWAPESSKELVRNFFEVFHDISVRVQELG